MVAIQIRNVPEDVHRTLKERAEFASRPALEEMTERLRSLPPVNLPVFPAEIIREEREKLERRLLD